MITDEQWCAIQHNDASYDTKFIYAVKTTGIFCKPSCKSRVPVKENVTIFRDAEQALAANFRPCKRCEPIAHESSDRERVDQIVRYIDNHYKESITLETLANVCHGSPYHLHRTFKRVQGMTTVAYIHQTRIGKAKEYLTRSNMSVAEIAAAVGMANTAYFVTLFKKKTGQTPSEFRHLYRCSFEGETVDCSDEN